MARPTRRNTPVKALGANIDAVLWDRLQAYSDETGVSKTFVIEKALIAYLDKVAPAEETCLGYEG